MQIKSENMNNKKLIIHDIKTLSECLNMVNTESIQTLCSDDESRRLLFNFSYHEIIIIGDILNPYKDNKFIENLCVLHLYNNNDTFSLYMNDFNNFNILINNKVVLKELIIDGKSKSEQFSTELLLASVGVSEASYLYKVILALSELKKNNIEIIRIIINNENNKNKLFNIIDRLCDIDIKIFKNDQEANDELS